MNIEQLHRSPTSGITEITVYQRVEALMVQAARDGELTLEEESAIVAVMTRSGHSTADVCCLYRRLQERVWDGELQLPRSRR